MPASTTAAKRSGMSERRVPLILALAAMLGMVNMASLGAFMPDISDDLNVSVPLLGQITTVTFIGAAMISIFSGPLADLYGKRRLLVIGLCAVATSAFGTMLAPDYGWLLATRMISSVSGGILAGTTLAMAGTIFEGDARRRVMSWIASGMAAGAIVGIPFLTIVASLSSWRGAYAVVSAVALLWILLIKLQLPNDAADGGRLRARKILAAYRPLMHNRTMLRLYGSTVLRAVGWVGILTYIGAYLGDELGLETSEIGWAYMAGGGGYFIGTKIAGGRLGGHDLKAIYGIGTIAMGVLLGLAVSLPVGAATAIGIIALAAIAGGFGWVALVTLVSSSSPAGQGTTMSLNAAMFQIGSAFGGLCGGLLLAIGGYATLGLGLMGFAFLAASLVWRPAPVELLSRGRLASAND